MRLPKTRINHRYTSDGDNSALCEWSVESSVDGGGSDIDFVVRSRGHIAAGTDLSVSYGNLAAAGALLSYGFTPTVPEQWVDRSRSFEYAVLSLSMADLVLDGANEGREKGDVWLRDEQLADFSFPFLPRKSSPEEDAGKRSALVAPGDTAAMSAFLSLLRVAVSTPAELQELLGSGDGRKGAAAEIYAHSLARGGAVSWRNELAAMELLGANANCQLSRYPTTLESDLGALQGGTTACFLGHASQNAMNALRVVAGEKMVLHHIRELSEIAVRHLKEAGDKVASDLVANSGVPRDALDMKLSGLKYARLLEILLSRESLKYE